MGTKTKTNADRIRNMTDDELAEKIRRMAHCVFCPIRYNDLGTAIPKCGTCHDCTVEKPPQSWCYVEELQ